MCPDGHVFQFVSVAVEVMRDGPTDRVSSNGSNN